jgi:hypothetical protein
MTGRCFRPAYCERIVIRMRGRCRIDPGSVSGAARLVTICAGPPQADAFPLSGSRDSCDRPSRLCRHEPPGSAPSFVRYGRVSSPGSRPRCRCAARRVSGRKVRNEHSAVLARDRLQYSAAAQMRWRSRSGATGRRTGYASWHPPGAARCRIPAQWRHRVNRQAGRTRSRGPASFFAVSAQDHTGDRFFDHIFCFAAGPNTCARIDRKLIPALSCGFIFRLVPVHGGTSRGVFDVRIGSGGCEDGA